MHPALAPRAASRMALVLLACFGGDAAAQTPPTPAAGRALAAELGCGACHAGAPDPSTALARVPKLGPGAPELPAEFVFTWLADPRPRRDDLGATRMPDFRLDEGERVALALFLGGAADQGNTLAEARRRHPGADAGRGRRIFQALGCGGCHQGVEGATGIQAPDLSREGARVREAWLTAFLDDPRPVRGAADPGAPGARMPDFRLTPGERSALAAWLGGAGRAGETPAAEPLNALQTRRAERFLEERASCLGCHRIAGRGGAIGPSLEGLAERLTPGFVLEMILDPRRAAPSGAMPHQPMPRPEAERLARYLLQVGREAPREASPGDPSLADAGHPAWVALAPAETEGGRLYARHCAACHGVEGRGDGWNAPALPVPPVAHADSVLMAGRVDDALYDGIHAGAWVLDGSPRMPGFGSLLTPEQIRALVAHIRRLCACDAPAWSRPPGGGSD